MNDKKAQDSETKNPEVAGYESPKIETVVSKADLDREVQYAGTTFISNGKQ